MWTLKSQVGSFVLNTRWNVFIDYCHQHDRFSCVFFLYTKIYSEQNEYIKREKKTEECIVIEERYIYRRYVYKLWSSRWKERTECEMHNKNENKSNESQWKIFFVNVMLIHWWWWWIDDVMFAPLDWCKMWEDHPFYNPRIAK